MSDDAVKKMMERLEADYAEAYARFPKAGAKLRYRGTHQFWFPSYMANAERELRVGEVYTLKTIELAASWACITLDETGDAEFTLGCFEVL